MAQFVKAGTLVDVRARTSKKGQGLSYPSMTARLLEDARIGPDAGWDVVDLDNGTSAYSFDLVKAKTRKTRRN